jgi:hypothetical protein
MARTLLMVSFVSCTSLCTMLAACSSSSSPTPTTEDSSSDAASDSTADSPSDSTGGDAADSTAPDTLSDSAGYDSFTNGGDGSVASTCAAQGGAVSTQLCCGATGDFPNLCGVGACSCAPSSSHVVKICTCGAGKCWDGAGCVTAM